MSVDTQTDRGGWITALQHPRVPNPKPSDVALAVIARNQPRRPPAIRPATTERDRLEDFERGEAALEAERDRKAAR